MRSTLTKIPAACTFKRSLGQHTLFWEARSGKPQAESFANGNLQRRVRQRWEGLRVIGADVVEVAPIYDNPGETTCLAAAQVAHSLLTLMVQTPVEA